MEQDFKKQVELCWVGPANLSEKLDGGTSLPIFVPWTKRSNLTCPRNFDTSQPVWGAYLPVSSLPVLVSGNGLRFFLRGAGLPIKKINKEVHAYLSGNYSSPRVTCLPLRTGFRIRICNLIRIRIRINLSCWIRIRIQTAYPDPDPGGQKLPTKIEKSPEFSCF